ncbi:elongation factor P 5-aminopentanone reductase [Bacillus suaedaesalsae]|uniref:SDR family oxidoreductase n=1 Tax=Bacillus suaedaesalsae TaxID=2810349 RepID=A0ABS2DJ12_9BACI|nr:SDR family oxidoreductase [Bacillus suaedaesalsae]MBM6618376.1 SDR family oxidoreductase [Bacillus suaedaesalsae]
MNSKTALLTGASGGIGKAIAFQLLNQGYKLYLHYHRNIKHLEEIANEFGNERITLVGADLSKPDGVQKLLSQIHDPIDDVILNSGNSYYGLMTDMTEGEVIEMVQLHCTSPFLLTQSLLPSMVKMKAGNIVLITSIWGEVGASCEVLYSMLKGGQNTFVKALAKEVAPSNIRVNGIAPGAINTNMLQHLGEEDKMLLEQDIPMGRMGYPNEVANVVTFLLSDQASYINGHIVSVNGAWYT